MINISEEERYAIRSVSFYAGNPVKRHQEIRLLDALEEAEYNLGVWKKRWESLDDFLGRDVLVEVEEEFLLEGEQND